MCRWCMAYDVDITVRWKRLVVYMPLRQWHSFETRFCNTTPLTLKIHSLNRRTTHNHMILMISWGPLRCKANFFVLYDRSKLYFDHCRTWHDGLRESWPYLLLTSRLFGYYREISDRGLDVLYQGRGLRFPCNDRTDEVKKLLIIGLFLLNPSLRSIKTTTGPRITWKTRPFNELYTLASDTVELHWSADAIFNSCQLTITWTYIRMPTINLNTAWICLGLPVSNARSLQEIDAQSLKENSQSERTYYCRHIIRGAKKI